MNIFVNEIAYKVGFDTYGNGKDNTTQNHKQILLNAITNLNMDLLAFILFCIIQLLWVIYVSGYEGVFIRNIQFLLLSIQALSRRDMWFGADIGLVIVVIVWTKIGINVLILVAGIVVSWNWIFVMRIHRVNPINGDVFINVWLRISCYCPLSE